jgi:hypothetical protein
MRSRFGTVLMLLATLAVPSAIACSPPPPALYAQVGTRVELAGTLRGPAKLGDFVEVEGEGEQVYLRDPADMPEPTPYDDRVRISGTLEYFAAPADAGCGDSCEQAEVPSHYFIRAAVVTPQR